MFFRLNSEPPSVSVFMQEGGEKSAAWWDPQEVRYVWTRVYIVSLHESCWASSMKLWQTDSLLPVWFVNLLHSSRSASLNTAADVNNRVFCVECMCVSAVSQMHVELASDFPGHCDWLSFPYPVPAIHYSTEYAPRSPGEAVQVTHRLLSV